MSPSFPLCESRWSIWIAGEDACTAPVTIVFLRRLLVTCGAAGPIGLIAAGEVVAGIAQEESVGVRIGVVGAVVVREAVGLGPTVLAVVEVVAAPLLRYAGVPIKVEDVIGIARVLVSRLQDVPRIGRRRGVGESSVVVDHITVLSLKIVAASSGQGKSR